MIEAKRREGESVGTLLFRFGKKVKRSGVLQEARKRRFYKRVVNRRARRLSALHRRIKEIEVGQKKKLGLL